MAATKRPERDGSTAKILKPFLAADPATRRRMWTVVVHGQLEVLQGAATWGAQEYGAVSGICQDLRENRINDREAIGDELRGLLLARPEPSQASGLDSDVWGGFLGGLTIADAPQPLAPDRRKGKRR